MSDNTNKIAEKLAAQDSDWHLALFESVNVDSHAITAAMLSSIGLTVSDDAGVLAKARELLGKAGALGALMTVEIRAMSHRSDSGMVWKTEYISDENRNRIAEAMNLLLQTACMAVSTTDERPEPLVSVQHGKSPSGAQRTVLLSRELIEAGQRASEPTAETRGDDGFEKYWDYEPNMNLDPKTEALHAWQAARADLLAKVAGVRAELEAEKKTFCDAKHSDYHTGVVWGFVRSVRTLDAAFPSDPSEAWWTELRDALNAPDAAFPSDPGEVKS